MGFGLMTYPDTAPRPPLLDDESVDNNRLIHTEKFYEFFERRYEQMRQGKAYEKRMHFLLMVAMLGIIILGVFYYG